jgi:hypothetical protein
MKTPKQNFNIKTFHYEKEPNHPVIIITSNYSVCNQLPKGIKGTGRTDK